VSNYKYEFTVAVGSREEVEVVDLVDDFGWEEDDLDMMAEEDILDEVRRTDLEEWMRRHVYRNAKRIDG
jgi:hypothetical protein